MIPMTRPNLLPTVLAASAVSLALATPAQASSFAEVQAKAVARRLSEPGVETRAEAGPEVTVRLRNFTLKGPAKLHAGRHVLRVVNDGAEEREVVLVRLNDGKSAEDLYAWFRSGMHGEAPAVFVGGTVHIAPGGENVVAGDFAPGTWLLLSLKPHSGARGEPRVARGMILEMQVL
jgi:hypothetical protein